MCFQNSRGFDECVDVMAGLTSLDHLKPCNEHLPMLPKGSRTIRANKTIYEWGYNPIYSSSCIDYIPINNVAIEKEGVNCGKSYSLVTNFLKYLLARLGNVWGLADYDDVHKLIGNHNCTFIVIMTHLKSLSTIQF